MSAKLKYTRAQYSRRSLNNVLEDIKAIEKTIKNTLAKDEHLNLIYEQLTSVPGLGPQTALQMIISSNEFKWITEPKNLRAMQVLRLSKQNQDKIGQRLGFQSLQTSV
ncbi:hypothetical protein [Mucilaginibacter sp.]|uniref:hypothetical protein n=1 Tax=Mucilaginibacter sp. TaxID=1882438 RepID=UPI0035BC253C